MSSSSQLSVECDLAKIGHLLLDVAIDDRDQAFEFVSIPSGGWRYCDARPSRSMSLRAHEMSLLCKEVENHANKQLASM